MSCAVCAHLGLAEQKQPETTVGPLGVCGAHVQDALALLGYRTDAEVASITAQVVGWLEQINPVQLEQEALARMHEVKQGDGVNGRMFLAALTAAAKDAALDGAT